MQDFHTVITACTLLERARGVKLHRSLHRDKVKFLALRRWRGTLQQEDIPYPFSKLTLDFIGVSLQDTFMKTRKVNRSVKSELRIQKGELGKKANCEHKKVN